MSAGIQCKDRMKVQIILVLDRRHPGLWSPEVAFKFKQRVERVFRE